MNAIAWTIVALGIGVVVVRRRSIAVGLVTAQALLLAAAAFSEGSSLDAAVAAAALALRGAVLAALFLFSSDARGRRGPFGRASRRSRAPQPRSLWH